MVGLFGDSKHPGMAYHSRPEDDPYITQQGDSDSDKGDFLLKGTDRLILAARNEDDVSHLEVQHSSFRAKLPGSCGQQSTSRPMRSHLKSPTLIACNHHADACMATLCSACAATQTALQHEMCTCVDG